MVWQAFRECIYQDGRKPPDLQTLNSFSMCLTLLAVPVGGEGREGREGGREGVKWKERESEGVENTP